MVNRYDKIDSNQIRTQKVGDPFRCIDDCAYFIILFNYTAEKSRILVNDCRKFR